MKTRKIISIILAALLGISVLSSCNSVKKTSGTEATKMLRYNSYLELQNVIDQNKKDHSGSGFFNQLGQLFRGELPMQKAAMDTAGALNESANTGNRDSALQDYSKTNLQVEGVDEADIVKTDGSYLYIIANGRFLLVDAKDPSKMKIISQIQYLYPAQPDKNIITPIEMFLDEKNNRVTLISYIYDDRQTKAELTGAAQNSQSGNTGTTEPGIVKSDMAIAPDYYYGYRGQQNVLAQVIDLKDVTKPAVIREFSQEGSYISSRRIEEFVYIITNKYVYSGNEILNRDFYIPATKDSKTGGDWEMMPIASIGVVANNIYESFLVLSGLDTKNLDAKPDIKAVLGAGQNIYASPTNIYIASSRYTAETNSTNATDTADTADTAGTTRDGVATTQTTDQGTAAQNPADGSTTQGDNGATGGSTDTTKAVSGQETTTPSTTTTSKGDLVTTIVEGTFRIFQPPVYKVFTDLYRFEISKGTITEKGSGVVPGYILNQFSMDENNGFFRIATTTGDSWRSDEYTSMNNVYVLDSKLSITGKIEGLGTRETIKSVRFAGNKAYLVTFRTVDPLFVIDLSNPAKPEVKGELKIPGYSEYLHPISDTILLGFGKDAIEENNMAYYLGFKVSVFDVSDVTHPKEISTMLIGDRGTYSELSTNHKALMYSAEKNIIGFPITIYTVPEALKYDKHSYGMPTFTGYIVLSLTKENKLVEKGRISHYNLAIPAGYPTDYTKKTESWTEYERMYQNEYLYKVNRGMFIGDTLFTVSNAFVKANSLVDFNEKGKLDIPGFNESIQSIYPYAVK